MTRYQLKHITRYLYPSPVRESTNQIMLYPIEDARQDVKRHEIAISHQPAIEIFSDYFGNRTGIFSIPQPLSELQIQSTADVVVHESPLPADDQAASRQWSELRAFGSLASYIDFLWQEKSDRLDELAAITKDFADPAKTPFTVAKEMSGFVYRHFEYKKGITDTETGVHEIWSMRAGVCQDFAHVLLAMLRLCGIPARYVSGYICPKNHEFRGEGATHAWVEAFIPFEGWLGLDPTNNCIVSDRHIRLAVGRNFSDVTPVKGTYKGSSEHLLEVGVEIINGHSSDHPVKSKAPPLITYQAHQASQSENSYRRAMEMQQQQ
jgi:transglutaminase-like putative cysteine protease